MAEVVLKSLNTSNALCVRLSSELKIKRVFTQYAVLNAEENLKRKFDIA
jgi:hypothetical protein